MRKRLILTLVCLAIFTISSMAARKKKFDVYSDKGTPSNHFIPSGWIGDYGDLKFDDQSQDRPLSGATSIKIIYSARKSQNNGWAGIYWLSSQGNWGNQDSGFDLSKFNKLVFKARGEKGGEVITTVKVGGIIKSVTGELLAFPDSTDAGYGPIELTKDWEEYVINLCGKDLSYINGGFCVIFSTDYVKGEQIVYLDDIHYAYDPNLKKEEAKEKLPFYVYTDRGSLNNHFIPSGWMPVTSARDLRLNLGWQDEPFDGSSCMRIEYRNNSGTRWAGIYWQNPANNWGDIPDAGYNLEEAEKLTFWAKGERGGEVINEFKMGGIVSGEYMDSDSASIGPIQLTKKWKKYEIDLRGRDLSYVIGGFCWATNIDVNDPEGIVFYIDEVKYE